MRGSGILLGPAALHIIWSSSEVEDIAPSFSVTDFRLLARIKQAVVRRDNSFPYLQGMAVCFVYHLLSRSCCNANTTRITVSAKIVLKCEDRAHAPRWDAGEPFVEIVFPPSGNSVLVISSFSIALCASILFSPSSFAIVYYFSASTAHSPSFFKASL